MSAERPADRFLPPGVDPRRVAARVGLIADTHMPDRLAALPEAIFTALRGVDLLLHAGDVGELWVLERLSAVAPVLAVHGNDDTPESQRELPFRQTVAVAGRRIALSHAHVPRRAEELASRRSDDWTPKLERRVAFARAAGAEIMVFGHTHVPMALRYGGVLLINPGALAPGNFAVRQTLRSVALLFLCDDGAAHVAHVDIDAPGRPIAPTPPLAAGFRAALDAVSRSILAPDLAPYWPAFNALWAEDPAGMRAVARRAAMPVWQGERPEVRRDDLLAAVLAAPELAAALRDRLAGILTR